MVVLTAFGNLFPMSVSDATPDPFGLYGQVTKRIRWMPWQSEAMKDVLICEKRGGVDKQALYPAMSEWGNPPVIRLVSYLE